MATRIGASLFVLWFIGLFLIHPLSQLYTVLPIVVIIGLGVLLYLLYGLVTVFAHTARHFGLMRLARWLGP